MSVADQKTVCVDLDGVLNLYDGWKGERDFAPLRPGAVEFMAQLCSRYRVIVLTTRDALDTSRWLNENGVPHFTVTDRKPPAHVYLDDRAVCFDGSFDGLAERIAAFRTHWESEG